MRIIDLTQPISDGMSVYPGDPPVEVERVHTYEQHTWEVRRLAMGTHTGTHVDAFSHMHTGTASIDEMPLDAFFGPAVAVYANTLPYPRGVGLLFKDAVGVERFEDIAASGARFVGGDLDEALERVLLGAGIVTYTDLVKLAQLPEQATFMFYGLPLKISGGDGSPVRAIAIVPDANE